MHFQINREQIFLPPTDIPNRPELKNREMRLQRLSILLAIAALTVCFACQQRPGVVPEDGDLPPLLLFCGAGIQLPVSELVESFSQSYQCRMEVDYAGSELLLSRITLKKNGDLYMPGDQSYVDIAAEAGMIESSTVACYFVPTILVEKGNPKRVASLQDLTREGLRLGLGDAKACAIGRQSKKIFEKNNIPWTDVESNLAFQSLTVNELGIQIQAGSLDAVIVWDAVASQYLEHGELVPIPMEQNVISTVPVGILEFSRQKALARQFAEFAASERGQAIFRRHHYRVHPPIESVP